MSVIRHALTAVLLCTLLAGCQEDSAETSAAPTDIPSILVPMRAACEKDGGRWGKVPGRVTYTCYRTTSDANKHCKSERDCQGLCLARSQTCAPVTPFYGCHEILADSGMRQTLCTE